MWKVFLVYSILNYLYTGHVSGNTDLILPDNTEETETIKFTSVTDCIIAISNQELYFRPTVAILEQTRKGTREKAFINELIDKLTDYNVPKLILKDLLNEQYHDLHIHVLTIAFISKCNDVSHFDFKRIHTDMRLLMIISDPSNNDCVKKLEEIGDLVSRNAVTFIIQDFQTEENKIFTIFPKIDGNTCKEIIETPAHINTCFNGTIQNEEMFPVKNPENLNKCPFRVGMASRFPFSTIVNEESLKEYDRVEDIKGADFEIMKIINKHFNGTLDMHYINGKYDKRSGDRGFMEFMLNGSLDACAGGIYRVYGDIVEYSGVYIRQGIFWIYFAERPDRSWVRLASKLHDVYFFFLFYITYSFVWYFISLSDGNTPSLVTALLRGWGAMVGATSLQTARSNKQKLLNLMYLIMCIYFYAFISIQFYSFLTIRPPPHMLRTNSEVQESGKIPYLRNKFFLGDEKYSKFANTSKDCGSFEDCADLAIKNNGLSLFIQANFYQFQAATAMNDEARVLKVTENLMTVYNEMLIRKNSSLVEKFQSVMQRLFEAGMTSRLVTEAIGISWVAKATSANTNMISSSYSCQVGCAITLLQFAGIFYAWIFGCVMSCMVFTIEIFMKTKKD